MPYNAFMSLKLISLNVEMDRHYDTVIPFLKNENPDVICLQEVLEKDFEMYKRELGVDGFYKPSEYVYSPAYGGPKNERHGVAIFAKKLLNTKYVYYVGSEKSIDTPFEEYFVNGEHPENRVLLIAQVADNNREEFTIATTHFTLTHFGEATPLQLGNLELLHAELEKIPEFALAGDFNAPRGNATFDKLATYYKDNIPEEYDTSIDMSMHRNRHNNFKHMVDGLFTTPNYTATNVRLQDGLSDHMATVAEIKKAP